MIEPERILAMNGQSLRDGDYILYWMQAAQRSHYNHALEYAIGTANQRHKPLLAAFSLTDGFPEANLRHYTFMLEGLRETQEQLARRRIKLVILQGSPESTIPPLARKADLLVTDEGYLRIQRKWRSKIASSVGCAAFEITTNLIVPIEEASDKENFSAGTLRPRIHRQLTKYLVPLKQTKPKYSSLDLEFKSIDITDVDRALKMLKIDRSVEPSVFFKGGTSEAKKRLKFFIANKLEDYQDKRNDPMQDCQSNLSPYLHFGQISPLYAALEVSKTQSKGKDAFLEELIVRRELSHNFVYYNQKYDNFDALPPWALRTLNFHAKDKRSQVYTLEQLEKAQTYDEMWNASQMEMVITGKMHNYMRMYWGKKILEWTKSPKDAFKAALYLNNKYELDGRDPNGFAGVAWCFGKHDRPWGERPIFGKIRYMNDAGLKRKFNTAAYIEKIKSISNPYST